MKQYLILAVILIQQSISVFATDDQNPLSKEDFIKYFKSDFLNFTSLIFTQGYESLLPLSPRKASYKLVYNTEGYEDFIKSPPSAGITDEGNEIIIGKKIRIRTPHGKPFYENIVQKHANEQGEEYFTNNYMKITSEPLGYNIYLPKKGLPKAILVEFYGGSNSKIGKPICIFEPGILTPWEQELINQQIALVTLNTPDLLLLKDEFQSEMTEKLFNFIHKCLDGIYQRLHNKPENYHEDLNIIKGIPIFLYGASFGGAQSVRHSELYPETYNGYISHDGGISMEMAAHLMPMEKPLDIASKKDLKIDKIQDPILLLQNLDDNRVWANQVTQWYNRAIFNGKKDLIRVMITSIGNPILISHGDTAKGHGYPWDENGLSRYVNTLISFMLNGPSSLPTLSDWQIHETKVFEQTTPQMSESIEKRFLAKAYQYLKTHYNMTFKNASSPLTNEYWNDLIPMLYAIDYGARTPQLEQQILYLSTCKDLNEAVLKQGLNSILNNFVRYLVEKYNFIPPDKYVLEDWKNDPKVLSTYKEFLTNFTIYNTASTNKLSLASSILADFYISNRHLLDKNLIDPQEYKALIQKWNFKLPHLREELNNLIARHQNIVLNVWGEAINRVKSEIKKGKLKTVIKN